jgi:hypothetical protein
MTAQSAFVRDLDVVHRTEIVRDAYKKHSAELLALEDSQQKLVLLLLGIFGGGASVLASAKLVFHQSAQIGLTLFVVAVLVVAWEYTRRRDIARHGIRALLIQCEIALGFYEIGLFLNTTSLYPPESLLFPARGAWLSRTFWLAVLAAVGFLVVLWGSAPVPNVG